MKVLELGVNFVSREVLITNMELRLLGGRLVEVDFANGSDLGFAHFVCIDVSCCYSI